MNGSDVVLDDRLFTTAVTIVLVCIAALSLMYSSAFTVSEINVVGNSYFTDAEVVAMAGLTDPVNLFRVNVRECEARLKKSSKIEEAVVRKVLPNTLTIDVIERTGVGLIRYNGIFCEIDANGVVITDVLDPVRVELPVLTGLQPTYLASGEKAQPARIVEAAKIAGDIDFAVRRVLRELNIADPNNVVGYLVNGAMVVFGDSRDMSHKCGVLESILEDARRRGVTLDYVDVSVPSAAIAR
ncbi:MAG: FtsQ-type POTRA domain-containing protein [Bacillota bacterium]